MTTSLNFIEQIIEQDNASGKHEGRVHTRFPPEPNGYLHIGHAKAICLSYSIAQKYDGKFNLRFDDTNPIKEEQHYVDAIQEDVAWLGADWEDRLCFSSDYFPQLFDWALQLIDAGKAFVCDLTPDEMREYRGSLKEPGKNSPYRDRTPEENRELFLKMRAGEFPDGSKTLRAKIDMASPNLNLRDPIMYRIARQHHHRTGDEWCIYPMYDFTHGQSDSLERITHSLCTLEFENHRPLYDWYCENLGIFHPQQIEFARLNLTYTVMSKRKLLQLVEQNLVNGWDDPRMPTLSGMRRRGYSAQSIRDFCETIGVNKMNSTVDFALLEHCVRSDLNKTAPRVMGVLRPIKLVVTNYPEGQVEEMEAVNNPEDPEGGTRQVPFTRELWIEAEDFMEDAPKKYFRLAPGREVRLRYAYLVTCTGCKKDDAGNVVEVHCEYDPETRGGDAPDGRRVKGTIHWVSATENIEAEVRLYENLFSVENPDKAPEGKDFTANLSEKSLEVIEKAYLEPSLSGVAAGTSVQFERIGYFCADKDSTAEKLVFNRTATLRDSWAKQQKQQPNQQKQKKKKQGNQQKKKPPLDPEQLRELQKQKQLAKQKKKEQKEKEQEG